jgi:hypothetical protein
MERYGSSNVKGITEPRKKVQAYATKSTVLLEKELLAYQEEGISRQDAHDVVTVENASLQHALARKRAWEDARGWRGGGSQKRVGPFGQAIRLLRIATLRQFDHTPASWTQGNLTSVRPPPGPRIPARRWRGGLRQYSPQRSKRADEDAT